MDIHLAPLVTIIPLPPNIWVFQPFPTFAQHIHDLYAEIRHKIAISNDSYKLTANMDRRDISFEASDFVIVIACIQPERLPKNPHRKLYIQAMGPYQII